MLKKILLLVPGLILSSQLHAEWVVSTKNIQDYNLHQVDSSEAVNPKQHLSFILTKSNGSQCQSYKVIYQSPYSGEDIQTSNTCRIYADGELIYKSSCDLFGVKKSHLLAIRMNQFGSLFNENRKMIIKNQNNIEFSIDGIEGRTNFPTMNLSNQLYTAYVDCMLDE